MPRRVGCKRPPRCRSGQHLEVGAKGNSSAQAFVTSCHRAGDHFVFLPGDRVIRFHDSFLRKRFRKLLSARSLFLHGQISKVCGENLFGNEPAVRGYDPAIFAPGPWPPYRGGPARPATAPLLLVDAGGQAEPRARLSSASPVSQPRPYGRGITCPHALQVRCASLSKKRA
jgi:hypothetical protein